jgi:hypothetical protein
VRLLAGWVVAVSVAWGPAYADVPVVEDVTACNEEARAAVRGSTAFPTARDESQAEDARAGRGERPDLEGAATRPFDPQFAGIEPDGAKNATYRSAYRVCMRKKGF